MERNYATLVQNRRYLKYFVAELVGDHSAGRNSYGGDRWDAVLPESLRQWWSTAIHLVHYGRTVAYRPRGDPRVERKQD